MKTTLLVVLLSGTSIFSLHAQIYTPSSTIQGSSGNTNVGIGATAPTSKLAIQHTNDGSMLSVQSSYSGNVKIFEVSQEANDGFLYLRSAAGLVTAKLSGYSTVPSYVMTNVGIGTTTPQAKLDVVGGVSFTGGRLHQSGDLPNDNSALFYNTSATGYGFYSQGGGSGRYAFHFLNKDGLSMLYGKGDGKIGVGTTSPDAKLTVKGNIHAEEVKVDLNVPAPDYVFETEYNLLSLQEVQAYIRQNKHLPEVPAAKEMEQNGVNLSEMNMLLLKKVEELTLYLLEQEKTNLEQNKRIELLSSQLTKLSQK
jgi:hypothetical protein